MKSKFNVEVQRNLSINHPFYGITKIVSILISITLLISSFIGDVGRIADDFYISNGYGISKIIMFLIPFSILIYVTKIGIEILIGNRIEGFSINEMIIYILGTIGVFNYLIYFEATNDKRMAYLLIVYFIIWGISILGNMVIKYRFWKDIYEEGVKLYGDRFKEYHEVVIENSKPLTDEEQFNICINALNFDDIGLCGNLVKLHMKYKKWRENK
ncbi:MAG: hypothetical protein NSGCLCUN01_02857 [uncultured Clostridium sp.]